jgi:hypothetical protein
LKKDISTPLSVQPTHTFNGHRVEYRDLREVAQGGPEVGWLAIDEVLVGGPDRFGGPLIYSNGEIFIPCLRRGVISWGFRLARIDLEQRKCTVVGPSENLIFLDRIDGDLIYYSVDLDKSMEKTIDKRKFYV